MSNIFIGSTIFIITLVVFFIASAVLLLSSKLLKVTNVSYKKSMLVMVLTGLSGAVISIILLLIGFGFYSNILSGILVFFIFSYLFKKHYQVSWKKSLLVYVVYYVIGAVLSIVISLVVIVPIRFFVFEPFVVSGQSMSPHLNSGDYLFIAKFYHNYNRDDVVVFGVDDNRKYLIKRVIGLPLEKVTIADGLLYINDVIYNDQFISNPILGDLNITLGANEYFVLSDNTTSGVDYKKSNIINFSNIKGKVFLKSN